jgi:ATP-dependent RNA helicase SUPV3L1/SUV3
MRELPAVVPPDVAGLTAEDAARLEQRCAARITELLPGAIAAAGPGRCADCGVPVAPRFPTCRSCAAHGSWRGAPVRRGTAPARREDAGSRRSGGRGGPRRGTARRAGRG